MVKGKEAWCAADHGVAKSWHVWATEQQQPWAEASRWGNNKHAKCLRGQAWESVSLGKYNVEGTMDTRKLKNLCIYPEHEAHSEWPEISLNFHFWLEFGLSESSEAKAEFNMAWLSTEGVSPHRAREVWLVGFFVFGSRHLIKSLPNHSDHQNQGAEMAVTIHDFKEHSLHKRYLGKVT